MVRVVGFGGAARFFSPFLVSCPRTTGKSVGSCCFCCCCRRLLSSASDGNNMLNSFSLPNPKGFLKGAAPRLFPTKAVCTHRLDHVLTKAIPCAGLQRPSSGAQQR